MNKKLVPAFLLTFVNVLGISILMPILPFVVASYGAPKWVYGLLLTLYSAFQFFGAPYLGALSDSMGRRPILMASHIGTLLSWFVFVLAIYLPEIPIWGFALPLWIIALARILDGVTGGNNSVAIAYVADITTREEKSFIFGYLGGIGGLGMIVGPALGGLAASSPLGYLGTLLLAIGISTFTLITLFLWIKESHPPEKRKSRQKSSVLNTLLILRRMREVKPKPIIKLLFLLKLFFMTMMAFYIGTIPLFLIDLFKFNEKELGFFMLVVGAFLAFNQAFVAKRFIQKLGEYRTLLVGLGLVFCGLFCLTLTDNLYLFIGFYYIMNLGLSLSFPTFNALISIHANPQKQGEVMGISESIASFCMAAFPIAAAAMYGWLGYEVYYLIAALPLTAFIIAFLNRNTIGSRQNTDIVEPVSAVEGESAETF
ncbi:MAG: MFS transporter [Bacteroidia bacterium]|nr:MFS transporter [Bacteroidia bacterium]